MAQTEGAAAAICVSVLPTIASTQAGLSRRICKRSRPFGATWEVVGMRLRSRRRFWIEMGLAGLSAAFFTLTLVLPDWIEAVFGVDPDRHSGLLEWVLTAVFGVMAVFAVVFARREWERPRLGLSTTR